MEINELIENFELLEDWEDKYRYLIDLGGGLEPLDEKFKTEEFKVKGCQSQVWLVPELKDGVLSFKGDSDAIIVRGLIAVVLTISRTKRRRKLPRSVWTTSLHGSAWKST